MKAWPLALLLLLGGCFIERVVGADPVPTDTGITGLRPPGEDDDTGLGAEATWGVAGTLVLVDGELDPDASSLRLETRGVDCSVAVAITSVGQLADGPAGMTQGWVFETAALAENACTWRGPATLRLGVGATDPQLRPAADRAGLSWDEGHGLYLAGPRGDLFLVGLAVPEATADTEATTVELQLETLHGIPLGR